MPGGGPWCGPPLCNPGACCALLTGVRFALLAGARCLSRRCFGELKFSRCWLFFCRIQKWTTIKAKLLSEIAWGFQKANIGPRTAIKCIKMEGNVGFLRRPGQNRQRREISEACLHYVQNSKNVVRRTTFWRICTCEATPGESAHRPAAELARTAD